MSNKATCPACDAHTSSVWMAIQHGSECPYCGLPVEVMLTLEAARERGANEALIETAAAAEQRAAASERRARILEGALRSVGHDIESALKEAAELDRSSSGEQPPPPPPGSAGSGGGTNEGDE